MISETDLLNLKLKSFPILIYYISTLTYCIYRCILTWKTEKKPKTQSLYCVECVVKHGRLTKMTKCGICGSKLHLAFTKQGTRILICPNIEARVSSVGIGNIKQLELWCDMEITNKQIQPVKELTREQNKAVKSSIKHDGLKDSFNKLIGDKVLTELKQSTFETIPDNKLLSMANLAIMLDIPVFQIPELFNAAMKLSRSIGLTPEKGIEAISKGIGRQSRKILDNIGILFKREQAYAWYSKMYELDKLTETEKSEAWKQFAIEEIIKKAALLGCPHLQNLNILEWNAHKQMEKMISAKN